MINISTETIKRYIEQSEDCFIYLFDILDSTNTQAKRGDYPINSILIAKEQSGGRGRLGKSFFSPKNSGIYMSIIIKAPDEDIEKLTERAGLLVIEAIYKLTGIKCEKRRINDIYLKNKKICGILAEGIINPNTQIIEKIVIGIGLNVHSPDGGFPAEIAEIAGSLYENEENIADINILIAQIINYIFTISTISSK